MNNQPLSAATRARLKIVFEPADQTAAEQILLEKCGNNLPLLEKLTPFELDRYRFAAIKISGGTIAGLEKAIDLANIDWRDLLMSAGFGHSAKAHENWQPTGPSD